MESFHQIELIMMSKMEPTSPSSSSSSNEDIIYEDNYANDHFINELNAMDELITMEHKKNVADILCELEGDKYLSKEFQSTSDKLDLPLYDFVQSIAAAPEPVINHPLKTIASTVNNNNSNNNNNNNNNKIKTEQLLMELDFIYDELTHLTPPQTPPEQPFYLQNAQDDFNEQQQQQQFMYSPLDYQQHNSPLDYQQHNSPVQQQYIYDQSAATSSSASLNDQEISLFFDQNNLPTCSVNNGAANFQDLLTIDQEAIMTSPTPGEMEVVAELLYSHTEKQSNNASTSTSNADWNTDDDCSTGFSSSSFSQRSEDTSSVFSQDDDEPTKKSKSGLRGVTKKRTRPYARGGEDKKSRKKEQNKNAATRYRQKKKQEVEVILDEERILMNKNDKLMDTFQDTCREVKYLKSLLRDLFKARGFIQ